LVTAKNKIIKHDRNSLALTGVEKAKLCKEVKNILEKSDKKTMVSFTFKSHADMLKIQRAILEMG